MTIAKRNDWQTKPFSPSVKNIPFHREFSEEEMKQIKFGLIPKQMEDKWFIFYEDDKLNFHRSWTGNQLYQLAFSYADRKASVINTIVNRDPSEYNYQDDYYDLQLIDFLIDRLLLSKNVPFPKPDNINDEEKAIYRHSLIGYGGSNKEQ